MGKTADLSLLIKQNKAGAEAGVDNTAYMTSLTTRQATKLFNSGVITLSGTSQEYSGIPVGAQKVTIQLINVTISSGAYVKFELGSSSGYPSTGYSGVESRVGSTSSASANQNTAYAVWQANAGIGARGSIELTRSPDNRWVFSGALVYASPGTNFINGRLDDLVGDLSKIRFSTGSAATLSGDLVIWWEF